MFILRSLRNPKKYIQIGSAPIRIGRGADNTLIIRDKSVSRAHATIQIVSGAPILRDLNSMRGTYVNGEQVQSQQLNPGDVITFGTVQWKFEKSTTSRTTQKNAELILASISNPRQKFHLPKGKVHIGRSAKNQLRILDKSISREHALIQFENGKFILIDKNSSSGTFVNNRRVQKVDLKPGDVITFGNDQWRLMSVDASQLRSISKHPVQQASNTQIYIGNYSLSPDPIHGGRLKSIDSLKVVRPQDRRPPIFVRPCHFGEIVDRKTEVKAASVSGPNSPLQFYGPHGAGKSTLLCYLAHHSFAATFPDGVVHLLARGRGVLDILQKIYDAFYVQPDDFVASESEMSSRLRSKTALIMLDDVELNQKDTSVLLAAAPSCTFILTSTKKCLPNDGRIIKLENFESEDALALFGKVLGRGLNAGEIPLVKTICSVLENNPVRIIQAASHIRGVGQSIGNVAGALNVETPINGLNNLIIQSLSKIERFIVAILAALGGGSIHNRHLLSLVGTKGTKQVLEDLMGRGLVRESDKRYSLAGNFVEYLQQEWDLTDWATRILEHFSGWVERHQEEPEYVIFEFDAILTILTWGVKAGRWQDVLRLSRGVENIMMAGKQWGAWQTVLQSGLQAAQMVGDRAAEAWALHQLGTRALCLGDSATAQSSLNQAIKIRQSIGDRVGAELSRQNQSLLTTAIPAPAKLAAPTKTATMPLRPWFILGGVITGIATFALIIFNLPEPPVPIPEPTTVTSRIVFTNTPHPEPVAKTLTPSRTPTAITSTTRPKTITQTDTKTATFTKTKTITPTNTKTATPTKTKTITPTITPQPDFGSPQFSTDKVYYGDPSCGSNNVKIGIHAEHPAGITVVVFFHKLSEINSSNESEWSSGISMIPEGGSMYSLTVSGDRLVEGTEFSTSAQVVSQFVIQPQSGTYYKSPFYRELSLFPCTISPPPLSTESPLDITPPSIKNISLNPPSIGTTGCSGNTTTNVSATVSDTGGVYRVVARIIGYGDVGMSPSGGNLYQATLGPFSSSKTYSIYILAWDNAGNPPAQAGPLNLLVACIE